MKAFLNKHNQARLSAYRECPQDLREHHGIEQTVLAGGYGYRQILELVQNGADAIMEAKTIGKIEVLIHGESLYVANTGAPLSTEGLQCLLSSHSSPKRGNEIGRFGLGFKSLLRLGGEIDILTCDSGAIRFDPERCSSELKERFGVLDAPALRLAWPLEESQIRGDSVLDRFPWAQTIIRARVANPAFVDHLREEIRGFPTEFLLFLQTAVEIRLDDGAGWSRGLSVRPEGGDFVLASGDSTSRWRVTHGEVPVDDAAARADATHIHARDSVPLAWAIPVDSKREEAGRFWAFFPTHTPTYLPGILNAPWKLNSDRNAVIPGEWNHFLMRASAQMIAKTLPSLSSSQDPGRVLDFFPRQMQRADEDAAPLLEALWKTLAVSAVLPDGNGSPQLASVLKRPPTTQTDVAKRWEELAREDARQKLIHSSCLAKQRISRLDTLAEHLKTDDEDSPESSDLEAMAAPIWFAFVASSEADTAKEVLKLTESFSASLMSFEWNRVRSSLPVVPVEGGSIVTPREAVFAAPHMAIPGRRAVVASLASDPEARRILEEVLSVKPVADDVWMSVLIETFPLEAGAAVHADDVWGKRWAVLRSAPETVRSAFLKDQGSKVWVRRTDGCWTTPSLALLPGAIVSNDDSTSNRDVLVDFDFHRLDQNILKAIGVKEIPDGYVKASANEDYPAWVKACRTLYRATHENSASWAYLTAEDLKMPSGRKFLLKLTGKAHANLTKALLNRLGEATFSKRVKFGHCTVGNYPKIEVSHPLPWLLMAQGSVLIGSYAVRFNAIHARRSVPALMEIEPYTVLDQAFQASVPQVPVPDPSDEDIDVLWRALIEEKATPGAMANDSLRDLWIAAAADDFVPDALPFSGKTLPLSEVFVSTVPNLARRVRRENRLVVTLDEKTALLWVSRGARELKVEPVWKERRDGPALLGSVVPEIMDVLTPAAKESARCISVISLGMKIEDSSEPVPCLFWNEGLLLDIEQLQNLSRAEKLATLLHALDGSGWLDRPVEDALSHLADSKVEERRNAVSRGKDLAERLLLAVGRKEALLTGLGTVGALEWVLEREPLEIARLALASFGPATLMTYQNALEQEGLQPPSRWGTTEARDFVTAIGFPVEFASSPAARREPEEIITGPIHLPPLHDFQEQVFAGIEQLLANGEPRRRAVISLPTGGGKTRVTVEAAVCLVLKQETDRRSVLWIAQTDELCEQAVQAFRQVWLNKGAQRTDLRIVRLWASNPNPSPPADGKPVVVVASIQTLNNRMGITDLAWLECPGLVVIDECHHAIAPSYTGLLGWLNAAYRPPGAEAVNEPPILGLSATPFRMDDDESARLAKRFDQQWLPDDQAELHARLLAQGVLARVENEELASGAMLSPQELDALSRFDSMEGIEIDRLLEAINQRLAGDAKRNERIIERLRKASERSILLFANSVDHATELSARLNLHGIPAAAISGGTARSARRWFLDGFQRGEIRVLCNHSVLTTGFDAPKTDLILISRQVFSPVRYMQMVGRGMRGPKNGGTQTCRIVSVLDNLGRFQNRHPYHYCRQYFENLTDGATGQTCEAST
jgi:superfamily II DNA or RNA helicase